MHDTGPLTRAATATPRAPTVRGVFVVEGELIIEGGSIVWLVSQAPATLVASLGTTRALKVRCCLISRNTRVWFLVIVHH